MYHLVIKDSAVDEIKSAFSYLESKEKDLGEKMLQKLTTYLRLIESNPFVFKAGYRQVRQAQVHPFEYLIRYKIYSKNIIVIQYFHAKRNPRRKRSS